MLSDWRRFVVVLSLLIVVVGALMPDACADNAIASITPISATVSMPHTGDQPFGCQHEEDCFCCAHVAPLGTFDFCPLVDVSITEPQQYPSSLEQTPSVPYHPPKA